MDVTMDKYLFVGRAFGDEGFVYLAEGLAFNQVSSYSNRFIYGGIFFLHAIWYYVGD